MKVNIETVCVHANNPIVYMEVVMTQVLPQLTESMHAWNGALSFVPLEL